MFWTRGWLAPVPFAVTGDHSPQPGYVFEADPTAFSWYPTGNNSGAENQFNIKYVGTHQQAMPYWFRYEINGVTMPYSSMHYGAQKGLFVRTQP